MVVFSRIELLNQQELLEQAIFGKDLLEKQLAYLLSSLRKMSRDITTSWRKLMEKDSTAINSMATAISKETSFIEQTAKLQPEYTIANVVKEQTGGLTIPKVQIVDVQKYKEHSISVTESYQSKIPVTVSFSIDSTIDSFIDYYNEILNYVDRIINLQRLVKKIKKTRRQLAILEKEVIPELRFNIRKILYTLNQRELEEKIRLMKVSKKLSKK